MREEGVTAQSRTPSVAMMPVRQVAGRRPLDLSKAVIPRGRVSVIPQRCKACNYCIEFCPKDVLVASRGINAKGYHYPEVAPGREEACIHCQFCSLVCPEFAIFTDPEPSS